jgi:hypothetical protein
MARVTRGGTTVNHDTAAHDEALDDDDTADQAMVDEVIDLETQKRLWVRALVPLLRLRSRDSDPSGRVQLALDLMHIAACERVGRILRSDLPDEQV